VEQLGVWSLTTEAHVAGIPSSERLEGETEMPTGWCCSNRLVLFQQAGPKLIEHYTPWTAWSAKKLLGAGGATMTATVDVAQAA